MRERKEDIAGEKGRYCGRERKILREIKEDIAEEKGRYCER